MRIRLAIAHNHKTDSGSRSMFRFSAQTIERRPQSF